MKLAYDEAVILVDNIIYYLKKYGVPALKAALEYVIELQCELGEMVYTMLHNKINAALGVTDEVFLLLEDDIATLGFTGKLSKIKIGSITTSDLVSGRLSTTDHMLYH